MCGHKGTESSFYQVKENKINGSDRLNPPTSFVCTSCVRVVGFSNSQSLGKGHTQTAYCRPADGQDDGDDVTTPASSLYNEAFQIAQLFSLSLSLFI